MVNVKLSEIAFLRNDRITVSKRLYISTENMRQNFNGIDKYQDKQLITGIAFNSGNILIANIRPYLKKVYFADFSGACSADVLVLVANENIYPKFLYYCIANENFINYVMNGGVKGTKMPRGDKKYIMQYSIPLPPLSEQHAIANTLAVFDNHINNLSELTAKKKAIREGALNDLMTGRTRLKGFCSAWEVKKLGDIGVVKMCRRIFQHQTKPFGQIPFYKIGTFGGKSDAYISRELYENYKRLYPYPKVGDILLSAAGTIGRAVMFDGRDSYFQDSNIVWLDVNHDILCNKFLMYFYQAHKWQNLEGTTIRRLYNSIILDTQIPRPPLTEQQAIADTLTAFDNEILALESERDKIIQIRDGAMNDLLTGKVRLC